MKINKIKNGFSLVELSIVLIIIALIIAGIVSGKALVTNSKLTVLNSEMQTLKIALGSYISDYGISTYSITNTGEQPLNLYTIMNKGYLDKDTIYNNNAVVTSLDATLTNVQKDYYKSKINGGGWMYSALTDTGVVTGGDQVGVIFANATDIIAKGTGATLSPITTEMGDVFKAKFAKSGSIAILNTAGVVNAAFLNGAQ